MPATVLLFLQELEELIEGVEADGIDVRAAVDAASEPAAEHGEQQVQTLLRGASSDQCLPAHLPCFALPHLSVSCVLQRLQACTCCFVKMPSSTQFVTSFYRYMYAVLIMNWPETLMLLQRQQSERPPSLLLSPGLLRRVATSRAAHEVDYMLP